MQTSLNDIDDMIVHEKMQAALEYQNEAWADGMADGIEPEIIADAAIAHSIRETIRIIGEHGAEALLESLRDRMLAGAFSPNRALQYNNSTRPLMRTALAMTGDFRSSLHRNNARRRCFLPLHASHFAVERRGLAKPHPLSGTSRCSRRWHHQTHSMPIRCKRKAGQSHPAAAGPTVRQPTQNPSRSSTISTRPRSRYAAARDDRRAAASGDLERLRPLMNVGGGSEHRSYADDPGEPVKSLTPGDADGIGFFPSSSISCRRGLPMSAQEPDEMACLAYFAGRTSRR